MKAEFRSEDLGELPGLVVPASTEIEWRALQLFIKLMDLGRVKFTVEYDPPED